MVMSVPEESRFTTDPDELVGELFHELPALPGDWSVATPDPDDPAEVERLTDLLRAHEDGGRGWPGASADDVLVEVSEDGLRTRENVVVRDAAGVDQAWGSVHDRAGGRMLFVHVVSRDLDERVARACSDILVEWAVGQARAVGSARGLAVQQIDTGSFAGDERQDRWLATSGFEKVRTWWQMGRPVDPDETSLVPSPARWEDRGVRFRLVGRAADGSPDTDDLRAVHDVLEEAFRDHFNSYPETFAEFVHRLREDPGHRWNHWWVAELLDGPAPEAVGALVATSGESASYIAYIGVRAAARGRGVAKGLLRTVVADAAVRGRERVTLEVDADSSTGADGLYLSMGWTTTYTTQSWHRDVVVADDSDR